VSQRVRAILFAVAAMAGGVTATTLSSQAPETGSIAGHVAPETGSMAGHVKLTSRVRGERLPSAVYPGRAVGHSTPPRVPEIHNVVVYLKDAPFQGTLPATSAEIRQEHETFLPHVLAITRGSTVNFPNGDPYFHNVFSLSRAGTFDLGRYPQNQARKATFTKPGLVKVYCRIHSQMSATILVLDHPYFIVPDEDGTFLLKNVPAGQYTIIGWHERIGERPVPVRVEPGKSVEVELTLPVEDPL
jgi:plastocyanin